MSVRVGVDGGQSTIRLRVVGSADTATSPGASHVETDPLEAVVDAVAAMAPSGAIELLVAGLTTIPADVERRGALAARLGDATGAGRVWVSGDEVTAHAGAFFGRSGVVLAVGTGVGCLAVDAGTGRYRSFDGAGFLLGDEGGAFWIGRHGIRAVLAADEGRGPMTSLTEAAVDRFGAVEGLANRIHAAPRAVDAIARFAPVVLEHAEAADAVASAIAADAAQRLAVTVAAAAHFLGGATEVSMTGRLLTGAPRLAEGLMDRLSSMAPDVTPVRPVGGPLEGACLLAERGEAGAYADLITEWRRAS